MDSKVVMHKNGTVCLGIMFVQCVLCAAVCHVLYLYVHSYHFMSMYVVDIWFGGP